MDYFSGWCKSTRRLEGITIIVTGSNSGIGRETAADLYRRGACVIMACRNIITAKEAKDGIEQSARGLVGTGELLIEELDLCIIDSVRKFCAHVTSRGGRVCGLVCSAGVMMCPESRTRDGFETHIASNHLGHALLTLLLLPLLIQNAPSRIVFVSSLIHEVYKLDLDDINFNDTEYTPLRAYANSKIANILFAKALDLKLKAGTENAAAHYLTSPLVASYDTHGKIWDGAILYVHTEQQERGITGVSTYSLHPGIVKTSIGRHFPRTAWRIVTCGFQNFLLNWCWKTPRCGAQTSIYCVVDENCENESGLYYSDCAKKRASRQCRSESEAEKLWNVTIDMLNLRDYDPFTQDSSKVFHKCVSIV